MKLARGSLGTYHYVGLCEFSPLLGLLQCLAT